MVQRRMGPLLQRVESGSDLVQEVVISVLRGGPRFVIDDRQQLRAFLARVAENVIRGRHDWLTAHRRDARRDAPYPSGDSVLLLDGSVRPVTRPSEAAAAEEQRALTWISLRLLEPAEREVIELRDFQELSFDAIGDRLGTSADAARMRYNRALPRLAQTLVDLRNQQVGTALARLQDDGTSPGE
jgi:RNA polymerase sigma-70 factor (ECF subfamily)